MTTTKPFDSLAVTSIAAPNNVLKLLAAGATEFGIHFYVTGDSKSPSEFVLEACQYYSLSDQLELPFHYARVCPQKSYSRKNIAYLLAMQNGAEIIVETDDDNFPRREFWESRKVRVEGRTVATKGWVNAYRYFSEKFIYPRGYPIDNVQLDWASASTALQASSVFYCPIQQALADQNPDVDAIFRMLYALPFDFNVEAPLILGAYQWCPFNSQNTTFFLEAFPLLYLPATCSFRMTDIWRSFIAQRILWSCGWNVSFHSATVYQERNEHDLLKDFHDEIPGYLGNAKIIKLLTSLELSPGVSEMASNLRLCYEHLIAHGYFLSEERDLLEFWLKDVTSLQKIKS